MRSRAALATALAVAAVAGCSGPETPAPPPPPAIEKPAADAATAALLGEVADLHREERYEEGIARLEEELARDPDRPRLAYNLGVFRASTGDYEGAVEAFGEELARFPGHPEGRRALGAALTRLHRLEDSLPHFEQCLAALPDDETCAFGLGRNLAALGRFADALPYLELAARARRDAEGYAELGVLYRRLGRLEDSAEAFAKGLADDPLHLPTLLGYGQALTALGREDDAEILLERHRRLAAYADQVDAFERASREKTPTAEATLNLARLHR